MFNLERLFNVIRDESYYPLLNLVDALAKKLETCYTSLETASVEYGKSFTYFRWALVNRGSLLRVSTYYKIIDFIENREYTGLDLLPLVNYWCTYKEKVKPKRLCTIVNQIKNGKNDLHLYTLYEFSKFLGVSMEKLVGRSLK